MKRNTIYTIIDLYSDYRRKNDKRYIKSFDNYPDCKKELSKIAKNYYKYTVRNKKKFIGQDVIFYNYDKTYEGVDCLMLIHKNNQEVSRTIASFVIIENILYKK